MNGARFSRIAGTGSVLPPGKVSNAELAARLAEGGIETSDEWIVERTGIRFRHFAEPDVTCSDLAAEAARRALAAADCDPQAIDLIIVATSTPDMVFPSCATIVQRKLGIAGCPAFDVQAVCSGFVYALTVADSMIKTGAATRALVIGSEVFSRILDFDDRTTCVLFGDGAGAVLLRAAQSNGNGKDRGVLSTHLHSDGRLHDSLYVDGGVSSTRTTGVVRMNGQEVFKHAVAKLAAVVEEALAANGLTGADIDWLVPHQANKRIIDGMARKLGLGANRVVATVDHHANTSAASIPLALAEAAGDGRLQQGQLVLIEAIGGGLAWGAGVIRW
jgi:3-oxoacyl-[acyl-carrier-protein] synthase III